MIQVIKTLKGGCVMSSLQCSVAYVVGVDRSHLKSCC